MRAFVRASRKQRLAAYPLDNALIVARSALQQVPSNGTEDLFRVLSGAVDVPGLGSGLLLGMAGAAEETPDLARVARAVWPEVVNHVLDVIADEKVRDCYRDDVDGVLENLLPRQTLSGTFFHRELRGDPESWIDVEAWRAAIDRWAVTASGRPWCLDKLIGMLEQNLSVDPQTTLGIPWARMLTAQRGEHVFARTEALPDWLRNTRAAARATGAWEEWRQLADGLVLAGRYGVADLED